MSDFDDGKEGFISAVLLPAILLCLIGITSVIAFFKFEAWRKEARNERKRLKALKERKAQEDAAKQDERVDEIRLANWKKRHPLGPMSEGDYAELYRLVQDRIASYETACRIQWIPVNQATVESIRSELTRDRDQ